ncbi:DUF3135 domain-containing protein [Methyloversatilis discipulorum]|uniref:DUF3135 domain-containing protein n=1 Tax=Methyloversatilis discipulorum TaxID=1119528 RepID=UPI001A4025A1|nr:DUF3135 domain-containing protein [Methyloversatilis discipulorum]MBL8468653.1 DUF3135 domain-containing protein [Methyloversatilis discipulorum]
MSKNPEQDFDFDVWKELAHSDPQTYFAERRRVIEQFINTCPPDKQAVLRDLQVRIDASRAMAGSPNQSVRELSRMMEDYLLALSERLMALHRETSALQTSLRQGLRGSS